jgi:hypothetical protein
MVWAVVAVIAVLGVGLPVAGWWITTHRPAPLATPKARQDEIDRWLARQFGLGWRDCSRVRTAVLEGKPVSDPALEAASRELATQVLDRRFRTQRAARITGRVGVGCGVAFLAFALAMLTVANWQWAQPVGVLCVLNAGVQFLNGWYRGFHAPRQVRRNAQQVLRSSHHLTGPDR